MSAADPPIETTGSGGLDSRVVRGVPWTILGYLVNKVVTLASTVVLARLLEPSDFGLVALASTVVLLLGILRDGGLANTFVAEQDLERREQGAVLALMIVLGVVVGLAGAALSPLVAYAFDEPRLQRVMLVLSLTLCFVGFNAFYLASLQRALEFRKGFMAQALSGVGYATVSIALAVAGAGVWSLVLGQVASIVTATLYVLVAGSHLRVRPRWDGSVARRLLRRGRGFLAQTGLWFAQANSDYLVIGRALGPTELGFYYTGYRLAEIPGLAVADAVARATFPGFTRMRAAGQDILPSYLSVLKLVALIACPAGIMLSATARPLTLTVYGDKWEPLVEALVVLGLWAALRPIASTAGWLLNSVDAAGRLAKITFVRLLVLIPALVAGAELDGIRGVSIVVVLHMVSSVVAVVLAARSYAGLTLKAHLRPLLPVALACVPTWIAAHLVARIEGLTSPGQLGLGALTGTAVYLVTLELLERGLVRRSLMQLRRTVGR